MRNTARNTESRTRYEWTAEHVNADGDVEDLDFWDSVDELPTEAQDGCTLEIGVVRYRYADDGDLLETAWAYVDDGKLPEHFEDAHGAAVAKVPARFHEELAAHLAAGGTIGGAP